MGEDLSRQERAPVEGEDFYREGAYVVFTAAYHLRRGHCCESGCLSFNVSTLMLLKV